jgi:hypothetical protein
MSKFPLNLLLEISKALVNSKIEFLIQKSFFLCFGPANLAARSASGPASPPAALSPQAKTIPAGPSSQRVDRVFAGNTFSLSDHAFLSRPPLPHLSVNRAPPVDSPPYPAPAEPSGPRDGHVFTINTFSLSDHACPSRPPLPRLSVNRAPPVRFTPFPAPAVPSRKSLTPPLPVPLPRASDALELLQPSLITLPP